MRKGYCITSDETNDGFVGIRFSDGKPEVVFPHGYDVADDEIERRKDVFRLLSVLKRFTEHTEGDLINDTLHDITTLPLTSYQYIIQDFLAHGYYTEKEVRYVESLKGKINWKRTIQKEQPQLDGENVVYLNFQVKTNQIKNDNLITKIHQYCVYQSFFKFGWLYLSTAYLPQEPSFKADKKLFLSVLREALDGTYNDNKRILFQSMIDIILDEDETIDIKEMSIGVNKFEGVWERMVDYVFGEEDKERYFPHATWHIVKDKKYNQSSALEPDTIMKHNGKIYVLDAKYYKYGMTRWVGDLPQTSSIQKQITYGKHIMEHAAELYPAKNVYNAFIMPFDGKGSVYEFVSVGTADWETYSKSSSNYAYVLGILIDTKKLISNYCKHNCTEIGRLAELIEESLGQYRNLTEQKSVSYSFGMENNYLEAAEDPTHYTY